jgi:hypothetical protein
MVVLFCELKMMMFGACGCRILPCLFTLSRVSLRERRECEKVRRSDLLDLKFTKS